MGYERDINTVLQRGPATRIRRPPQGSALPGVVPGPARLTLPARDSAASSTASPPCGEECLLPLQTRVLSREMPAALAPLAKQVFAESVEPRDHPARGLLQRATRSCPTGFLTWEPSVGRRPEPQCLASAPPAQPPLPCASVHTARPPLSPSQRKDPKKDMKSGKMAMVLKSNLF